MSFSTVAEFYDLVNGSAYIPYADYLEQAFSHSQIEVREVLDLGCGTGGICSLLADKGYDMVALDISYEMLNLARERNMGKNTLLLCQDMRDFELYGTVGAVCSCLDSINYLTTQKDLERCFSCVHNYLDPDGLFIFDVNTPYKFENIYANNHYIFEDCDSNGQNAYCGWQNEYDRETGICTFYLSVFTESCDGSYERSDEEQTEKCYAADQLKDSLSRCGFELVGFFADYNFSSPKDDSERWYIVARAKK